jgi:hypothetical protein
MFKNCFESSCAVELLERKGNVDHVDQKAINRNLKAGEFINENTSGPVVQFSMNAAFARLLYGQSSILGFLTSFPRPMLLTFIAILEGTHIC